MSLKNCYETQESLIQTVGDLTCSELLSFKVLFDIVENNVRIVGYI